MDEDEKNRSISRAPEGVSEMDINSDADLIEEGDVPEILQEMGIDPNSDPESLVSILLTKMVSQSTVGAYPPPMMLKEYNDIDPKIVEEILDGAKIQRDHRIAIENRVTDKSQARMDKAQKGQTFTAIFSIVVAALLAGVPPIFGVSIPWIVPITLIAVGVGGRPTATVLTKWIARNQD